MGVGQFVLLLRTQKRKDHLSSGCYEDSVSNTTAGRRAERRYRWQSQPLLGPKHQLDDEKHIHLHKNRILNSKLKYSKNRDIFLTLFLHSNDLISRLWIFFCIFFQRIQAS